MEGIAVVGYSFKLPGDVQDEASFWDMLVGRKNMMTEWPSDRTTIDSFSGGSTTSGNKLRARGAHFVNEDPAVFDAPFFRITAKEANEMDPQQRWALESSYRAFENAGISIESLRGSETAVFASTMAFDYIKLLSRDPDNLPPSALSGTAASILPNRLSWYYDLKGPSVHVDTACSSGLIAVDLACQSILNGSADMALALGSSMLLTPETSILLSNQGFLSPDSVCWSFDSRANGYSRGEGIVAMVLKPVSRAIEDGDVIRAVIRSTGTNQDGKTPSLTQPNPVSQEALIRSVYAKANLTLESTGYVEAHGTGTPVGDPIEVEAIRRAFGPHRSQTAPLHIGSVKSNIGHLEACSGLAGILKAIMILEKGIIPPVALLEKLNPNIMLGNGEINVPTRCIPWPTTGLRRVSVNSFGFGGTNGHVVLDDAYNFLKGRGLQGNHCTAVNVPVIDSNGENSVQNRQTNGEVLHNGVLHTDAKTNGIKDTASMQLLVWTAPDERSLDRVVAGYRPYYKSLVAKNHRNAERIAFTLAERRSRMTWRSFTVVETPQGDEVSELPQTMPKTRMTDEKGLVLVFTGQGAQYAGMGTGLSGYRVFRETLQKIETIFKSLGCPWSINDALHDARNIDRPEYSQPLTTALQIALFELLKSFNVNPAVVLGHSSGEIAAGYAAGLLSLHSACKVSLYRGQLAGMLRDTAVSPGAMMSTNIRRDEVEAYLQNKGLEELSGSIHIACINSPSNITLSGDQKSISTLHEALQEDGIFAQILKTGVAYHSPAMRPATSEYQALIGSLEAGDSNRGVAARMISSVTGKIISSPVLSSEYWLDNLVSPVRFLDTFQTLFRSLDSLGLASSSSLDFVEIGPRGALRRPTQDSIKGSASSTMTTRYFTVLEKTKHAHRSLLECVGNLFCNGHPVSISAANKIDPTAKQVAMLADCPPYPFDRSHRYWVEPRLSRDYRFREPVNGDILGTRFYDHPHELRWRTFLSISALPWAADHVVSNTIIFPGAGLLLMGLEAVRQAVEGKGLVTGYMIKEAHFLRPVILPGPSEQKSDTGTETILHLRPVRRSFEQQQTWFDITIFALTNDQWNECFRANVQVQYEKDEGLAQQVDAESEKRLQDERVHQKYQEATTQCRRLVDQTAFYRYLMDNGLQYGNTFQLLQRIHWDGKQSAISQVDVSEHHSTISIPVHPTVLDSTMHSFVLHISDGIQRPSRPHVPHQITDAWISARGWQHTETASVRFLAGASPRPGGQSLEGAIHAISDDGTLLCSLPSVVLRAVESSANKLNVDKPFLWGIEWKPQLSLLRSKQLGYLCRVEKPGADVTEWEEYHRKLNSILARVLSSTHRRLQDSEVAKAVPSKLRKYVRWLNHCIDQMGTSPEVLDCTSIEEELKRLEDSHPSWGFYPAIAGSLDAILAGERDPLGVAFDTGLAELFYEDLFRPVCDERLESLLSLLCHEKPGLRIIEVGAGTGGWTRCVLPILNAFERRTGANAFSEYLYTDISGAFFEKARERFSEFRGRMTFKPFDLERDPETQGIRLNAYDLVIAGSCLHATEDLAATIRNVRRLLKPGGYFLNVEPIAPEKIMTNFGFGLLPGWWLCNEPWRELSPIVNEETWDSLLRANGFSGTDIVLQDFESDLCHIASAMFSTASPDPIDTSSWSVLILLDPQSSHQAEVAQRLQQDLRSRARCESRIAGLRDIQTTDLSGSYVTISLLEVGSTFFWEIQSEAYESLKQLTRHCQRVLWVTSTQVDDMMQPFYSLMKGFWRSIRSEAFEKHVVTVEIERRTPAEIESEVRCVTQVFEASFLNFSPELEYVVHDETITSGRLVEDETLNDKVRGLLSPQTAFEPFGAYPPVKLAVEQPGLLDTMCFTEASHVSQELGPEEVEIETKAWALNFRDVFIALGRLEEDKIGSDCAGVVTKVGSACQNLKPGDRVCAASLGCFESVCRVAEVATYKIPDALSFEAASSMLAPGMTAYHSLVNIARLKKGEKILIHSASGGTGQMAIEIGKLVGAEIFATVGSPEKKKLLIEKGISPDHIFFSRNTTFAQSIRRVTNGYGVDVVLNSLSGDGLRASFECLAPYGRFVEIGKQDIAANSALPMARFARNITFSAVDLAHISQTDPTLLGQLLVAVMDLLIEGRIQHPSPLNVYPVSDIQKAFRFFQSGKHLGRVIINIDKDEIVPRLTLKRPEWKFDENASYLVAGGLGGLGREIARWMARRGARNIILPSRSGIASESARALMSELGDEGVRVLAPKCDVSSFTSLSELMRECDRDLPPIKGCINAAMALQDAVFDNMTLEQWNLTIASKVETSRNLSELLPKNLDFFVFLSSVSGVYGSVAQSNYAAGCAFQDALARWRVMRGEKALSLDVGWMRTIGIIAETKKYRLNRRNAGDMGSIESEEFLAALEICCDPSYPLCLANCQLMMGVLTPADFIRARQPVPALLQRPLFAGHAFSTESAQHAEGQPALEPAVLFREAASSEERVEVVIKSLAEKLSRALDIPAEEVDRKKGLADYGVDSLMATEVREWIGKQFQATVAVFDIMSGTTIAAIGALVVDRSILSL